jgi:DNA-binding CsgD family transcriptional regulator
MGLSQNERDAIRQRRRRVDLMRTHEPTITNAEIARRLDVDRSTISRDVQHLRKRREERHAREIEEARAQVLDRLDHIAEAAWDGWKRSTERIEERRVKRRGTLQQSEGFDLGPDGIRQTTRTDSAPVERTVEVVRKERVGDPRYLHVLLGAERERAKLYGLYDVQQTEDTGKVKRLAKAIRAVAETVDWEAYERDLIAPPRDAVPPLAQPAT